MDMPFNMILILCVIPCELSCDFSKLTIVYMYIYPIIFMTNKSVMTFNINKISICLSVICLRAFDSVGQYHMICILLYEDTNHIMHHILSRSHV